MKLPEGDLEIIASMQVDLLLETGSKQRITAWIGRPFLADDGMATCPCGVECIGPERVGIGGEDLMQALSLALKFLHRRLSDELAVRKLFRAGTPEPIDQEFLDQVFGR
jgi:hypothetical protein